jgi:vancomycin permeability regulator SanA
MELKFNRKTLITIVIVLASLAALGAAVVFGINAWVVHSGGKYILTPKDAASLSDVDCILVLGCGVWDDGRPSHMLEDRLKRGVSLYNSGAAPKLLMSGDHGRENYDEVNTMKNYAIEAGVSSQDIFMDHAGFSTYESMYRAKDIFCAEKIIIVSQQYHLYRAIYTARALGIEAYGVAADYRSYSGQLYRDVREILARDKDFFVAIFQPDYPYGGETIPVSGNGNLTNDK